jgi:hypothetical protein
VLATYVGVAEFRLPIFDCKEEKEMPDADFANRHPAFVRFSTGEAAFGAEKTGLFSFVNARERVPPNTLFSHHLHRQLCP